MTEISQTYAMARLLSLGPLTLREIRVATGWPEQDVKTVLEQLRAEKAIKYVNSGNQSCEGRKYALANVKS